ncbi:MAG: ATP-binding cassette domain-containing protein [Pseudomonadota bacterium]
MIERRESSTAYPDREEVLTNISLEIKPAETLAITCENGAGKITIAHLLMCFIDPKAGRI